jgi:hypothetical protein
MDNREHKINSLFAISGAAFFAAFFALFIFTLPVVRNGAREV